MENIAAEQAYPTPYANSPLLPLLLMSLAIQKHAPEISQNFKPEYDYIIIGAGAGGSVMAARLSEMPCVSVLLLEAGKPPPRLTEIPAIARSFIGTDVDWNYRTVPQIISGFGLTNNQVVWPSGKALGGSTILNAMLHVRGNRGNYDAWAAQGATGWSYNDVLPYFKKIEDNQDPEYVSNGFHGTGGPTTVKKPPYNPELQLAVMQAAEDLGYSQVDANGATQTGFYDHQANMRNGQRCSAAKSYLVPAENRTNLDILPNAFVKKVVIRNRRATGVQFDYGGKPHEVRVRREVILSAGTVNSAQLLMLSGVGPALELLKHRIPIIANLPVGLNFQDHQGAILPYQMDENIPSFKAKLSDPDNIQTYIDNRTGPLTSTEGLSTMAFLHNPKILPGPVGLPDHQLYFAEALSEVVLQVGVKPELYAQVFAPYENKSTYWCVSQILNPRSRGCITLRSSNPYDPPLINPNYYLNPLDIRDVVEGLKTCQTIGNTQAMKNIGIKPFDKLPPGCDLLVANDDLFLTCMALAAPVTLNHQVGTAKMGRASDPTTVVDPELRVKGIQRLRVVDASVMPLVPSGNTNVPTLMIAEKASDMIKRNIRCT